LGLHHFAPGEHLTLIFPQAPHDDMLAAGSASQAVLTRRADGSLVIDLDTGAAGRPGANVIDVCPGGACT
jgi:hypothetical protein